MSDTTECKLSPENDRTPVERDASVKTGWQPISSAPQGVVVDTKIEDERGTRNEQPMKRDGRLWWLPDGSMYVYFTPTHWRPLPPEPTP